MILVTGGSGLVGNELIDQLLADGKQVRAVYHKTPLYKEHPLLQKVAGDILDIGALDDAMEGVTHVYHCAALVSFDPRMTRQLYKVNAEGTANVVNAALSAKVKKFVHVSSGSAMGRLRENELINESMQWTTETSNSIYGHSKYLAELEIWRGIAEGMEAVIVNPTLILGAGDWKDSSTRIFRSVFDEFPWYTEGRTGFVDVKDVAKAMIMLMESDISAQRFIVSAENRTYYEVFSGIADAFRKKRPAKKVGKILAGMIWRLEMFKSKFTGKPPLVTKETARTALAKVDFDNSKLLQAIPGFAYTRLDQTIISTCTALQQKVNNL